MTQKEPPGPFTICLLSGGGNWVGDLLLYPLDTISTRLKASKFTNHNPFVFAYNSIKNDGVKLYRGISCSFPAAFIPTAIYIFTYESLMRKINAFADRNPTYQKLKLVAPFFISSFAEILTLFPYLPVDTVRTRIQMNKPEYEYSTLRQGLKDISSKEGVLRLYKSTKIYFACKTLYTAIQFECFELIRYYAGPSKLWMLLNTLISTTVAVTMLNPLEVLMTRYALVDTTKKKLVLERMVKRIYKREGVAGFYKGYVTELGTHCLYSLFWMPLYQILREKWGIEIQAE